MGRICRNGVGGGGWMKICPCGERSLFRSTLCTAFHVAKLKKRIKLMKSLLLQFERRVLMHEPMPCVLHVAHACYSSTVRFRSRSLYLHSRGWLEIATSWWLASSPKLAVRPRDAKLMLSIAICGYIASAVSQYETLALSAVRNL
jgi:hypothetical protein